MYVCVCVCVYVVRNECNECQVSRAPRYFCQKCHERVVTCLVADPRSLSSLLDRSFPALITPPFVENLYARGERKYLTSCAGTTCHARREYLAQNCNIFSVYICQVYWDITLAKEIINLLLLSDFHPVIRADEFETKATNYCTRFGHSLWSVNHLPAREAKFTFSSMNRLPCVK